MMLAHLGHRDAHDAIVSAIEDTIRGRDHLTRDMGGDASCADRGFAIAAHVG